MYRLYLKYFLLLGIYIVTLSAQQKNINIDILTKQAKEEGKYLVLFFHKLGCGYCEKMINITFKDKQIITSIHKNFIFVDIGIDDSDLVIDKNFKGSKHDYAKSLEVNFYPSIGFMDGRSKIVHTVIGYRDYEKFLTQLKYVDSTAYKTMEYEDFQTYLDFQEDR